MKQLLLSILACGMFGSAFSQIDPIDIWAKASVIAVDKGKNTVYVRKVDGAYLFTFSVEKVRITKFQKGEAIDIQFNNKKVKIKDNRTQEEERIGIPDLEVSYIHANLFIAKLLLLQAADKNTPVKNNNTSYTRGMDIVPYKGSNLVKACCAEGTKNGIEFLIPAGMTEMSLLAKVYPYNDLVLADEQNGSPPLRIYPVTGYWIDSTHEIDTSTGQKASDLRWDNKNNIAVRPNTSETDKWVINKVNAKGGNGKLIVNLPKGAEWNMTIYAAGSTKVISNTMDQTSFTLLPGNYDLEINHIWVRGVPVEKGNTTRLKTGVLHISTSTSWTLYDETKEKVLINSMSPQKRGLPVGKYKLSIMGQDQDIEIKDGETVEY